MQYSKKTKNISDQLNIILNSLDKIQLEKVKFDFNDEERFIWYYTPHEQNGLLVFQMKPFQRKLL